jgi:hypothetical protein
MHVQRTLRRVRGTIFAVQKPKVYSEYVSVALILQHANPTHRIILASVACPAVQYFPPLSHKLRDFRGKTLLNIQCVYFAFIYFFPPEHFSF